MEEALVVEGPAKLNGCVKISGAKNAALPILAATILSESEVMLSNIPDLRDVSTIIELLSDLGSRVTFCEDRMIKFVQEDIKRHLVSFELVKKMRASILVLGPLLARFGKAVLALPGGCAIGSRPIDIHLDGLIKMGASLTEINGYVYAQVDGKLQGADIDCHTASVTATENLIMAATLAEGVTRINNAACEPEVVDLGNFLIFLGAKISGLGTSNIKIEGVKKLGCKKHAIYNIIPDRIEAGTYLAAAAITSGKVHLKGVRVDHLGAVLQLLHKAGANNIETIGTDQVIFDATVIKLGAIDFGTEVYPGLPTDMQAQLMSLNLVGEGVSEISENIFENRYMHVPELCKLGAKIEVNGKVARVQGDSCLMGAPVNATDLRASASLVLAALASCGETVINKIYHMDRGYCQMELKLSQLGVKVRRRLRGL